MWAVQILKRGIGKTQRKPIRNLAKIQMSLKHFLPPLAGFKKSHYALWGSRDWFLLCPGMPCHALKCLICLGPIPYRWINLCLKVIHKFTVPCMVGKNVEIRKLLPGKCDWWEILYFSIKKYIRNSGKFNYLPRKNTFFPDLVPCLILRNLDFD